MMLFIVIGTLINCCLSNVYQFPEYSDDRLSFGPHLSFDEETFRHTPPGTVRDLTIEVWVYLDDW